MIQNKMDAFLLGHGVENSTHELALIRHLSCQYNDYVIFLYFYKWPVWLFTEQNKHEKKFLKVCRP